MVPAYTDISHYRAPWKEAFLSGLGQDVPGSWLPPWVHQGGAAPANPVPGYSTPQLPGLPAIPGWNQPSAGVAVPIPFGVPGGTSIWPFNMQPEPPAFNIAPDGSTQAPMPSEVPAGAPFPMLACSVWGEEAVTELRGKCATIVDPQVRAVTVGALSATRFVPGPDGVHGGLTSGPLESPNWVDKAVAAGKAVLMPSYTDGKTWVVTDSAKLAQNLVAGQPPVAFGQMAMLAAAPKLEEKILLGKRFPWLPVLVGSALVLGVVAVGVGGTFGGGYLLGKRRR